MPVFTFSGKNASGEKVTGERNAPNTRRHCNSTRQNRCAEAASSTHTMIEIPSPSEMRWLRRRECGTGLRAA